ncbi:MAG: branched-chain amino acid ABC transporter permease [Actinomycetota bacterium]|nr:branched-chain amino acid ABC transporter permease [Actinomycetota bacterium]
MNRALAAHWPTALRLLGIVALGVLVPNQFGAGWLSTLTTCVVVSLPAAGVGLLYGELGLTSLTQFAFAGLGGWIALRLGIGFGWPMPLLILAAVVVTAVFGAILSIPALRLRDLYLALVTLMVAASVNIALNAAGFPNGGGGFLGYQKVGKLSRLPRPSFATSDAAYFRLVLAHAAVVFLLFGLVKRSAVGRAWALTAQSEGAARSAGVKVTQLKVLAFAMAAAVSGLAGALIAGQLGQLAPSTFQPANSILLFALVVIGGARSPLGWCLAALLYRAAPYLLDQWGVDGNIATMIFGAAVIFNLLSAPGGMAEQFKGAGRKLIGLVAGMRRPSAPVAPDAEGLPA